MKTTGKIKKHFKGQSLMYQLTLILLVLSICLLVSLTWNIWSTFLDYAFTSLKPFIIGFIAAYILNPLVKFLQSKGLSKGLSIVLILLVLVAFVFVVLVNLFPMLYDEFIVFVDSIGNSIDYIVDWYNQSSQDPTGIFGSIIKQISTSFQGVESNLVEIVRVFITNLFSASLNFFTSLLFSITITIYMIADFDKFKNTMKKLAGKVNSTWPYYLEEIDKEMGVYVRSTLVLMVVYFLEYTFIYYIMGHKGYLMIGLLYVILGTLVPYIGGIIVTGIGILTGLALPLNNLIILIVLVMILSQVDGYVTSPLIYKKGVKIEPLASLLLVFIGSAVFGFVGVMLSMPFYIVVRSILNVNKRNRVDESEAEINEAIN